MHTNIPLRRIASLLLLVMTLAACGGQSNSPPLAEAGGDQTTRIGQAVQLDGSASSDPEGDVLTYQWAFTTRPNGSKAALEDADTAKARFTPDVAGDYELELTVSDGTAKATDGLHVTVAGNAAPTADAGDDQVVAPGDKVELDGRGSSDPDGDLLSYSWRFLTRPTDSKAALDDSSNRTPRFTADKAGSYQLELTVGDGLFSSKDTVSVRVNRPPVTDAGPDQDGRVGQQVLLNGSGSGDPDGDALSYSWAFISRPSGSAASLTNADSPSASFTPDAEGNYILELAVTDGVAEVRDRITVSAIPASGTTSSVLYVSPAGDDGNPGTESEPLMTLGAALAKASGNAEITRIQLAAGNYDGESFGYEIAKDLQIVGPEDPATPAVLSATGDLLSVAESAYLTLLRLTLQSGGTAVYVGDDAGASLVEVSCEATRCLRSGEFFGENGGTITITDSSLMGGANGTTGVSITTGDGLTITDSTIEGFDTGVHILGTPLLLNKSTLSGNGVGLNIAMSESTSGVLVDGSTFDGNDIGVNTIGAKNVTVRNTTVTGSTSTGVQVELGGGVLLEGVTIKQGGNGLVIARDYGSAGEVVTLRGTSIIGHPGHGIAVYGSESVLDLGSKDEPANNVISFNKGRSLYDARPDGASGLITLNGTILDNSRLPQPPAGTYHGPSFADYDMEIVNNNEVIVY